MLGVVLCGFITVVFSRNIFEAANDGTPLHLVAETQTNAEIIALLLKNGAKVNAQTEYGWTPLHKAAQSGKSEAVILKLLEYGAHVTTQDVYGFTPLDYMGENADLVNTRAHEAMKNAAR